MNTLDLDSSKDVEHIIFVQREKWVVLQTTDDFQALREKEKLDFINWCRKSLDGLEHRIVTGI